MHYHLRMELALALQERHFPGEAISPEQFLSQAFASFSQAADSLEVCYRQLQSDVVRLREQLEERNRDLADSLTRNQNMREFLERILDKLPCGVLVVDEDQRTRKINSEAQRLLGWDSDRVQFAKALKTILAAVKDQHEAEAFVTIPTVREPLEIAVRRTSLSENNGTQQTVLLLRDVTLERRSAEQREAMKRMQALAEMSAVLAHEIRNPLGVLELVTGVLESTLENNAEAQHWLTHLQGGLRTLSATVNNVLQFYSDPAPQCREVELAALIQSSVDFLMPLARQHQMLIRFSNHAGQAHASANPEQIQQVFFNLGINALRAMQPGGALDIALFFSGESRGGAVIQFRDDGAGIPAANLEDIFNPGFSTKTGSPGLGLPVCRRILRLHGGDIRVHSVEGEGSTFSLLLPLSGAAR